MVHVWRRECVCVNAIDDDRNKMRRLKCTCYVIPIFWMRIRIANEKSSLRMKWGLRIAKLFQRETATALMGCTFTFDIIRISFRK